MNGKPATTTRAPIGRSRAAGIVSVVVGTAAAAAGLAACGLLAVSPVGAWLGRILMWSGVAALAWDAGSSALRALRRRRRR